MQGISGGLSKVTRGFREFARGLQVILGIKAVPLSRHSDWREITRGPSSVTRSTMAMRKTTIWSALSS